MNFSVPYTGGGANDGPSNSGSYNVPGTTLVDAASGTPVAGNLDTGAIVTLTGASASGVSPDQLNVMGRGIKLVIDVTALTGTGVTFTATIQGKDTASGKYYNLLTSVNLTNGTTTILTVYPGLTAAANVIASDVLPRTWRVSYIISGTTPTVTAKIGASVIV